MISKWLEDLAADFWEQAGEAAFPPDLEYMILCCNRPVTVTALAGLRPQVVREWLAWRRFPVAIDTPDRPLNGCLVAWEERGFIFVEESLAFEDCRMIVAHEFAHYLADYEHPRNRARRRLGPAVISIFDGRRPPTSSEQVEAALAGVVLGTHVHYMERTEQGTYSEPTSQIEQTANELALELIAPWRAVLAAKGGIQQAGAEEWVTVLQGKFGLPRSWAVPYSERLSRFAKATRSFSESLGL